MSGFHRVNHARQVAVGADLDQPDAASRTTLYVRLPGNYRNEYVAHDLRATHLRTKRVRQDL